MKKRIFPVLALLLSMVLLVSCVKYTGAHPEGYVQFSAPQEGDTVAIFDTSKGTVRVVLFPEYAPLNVENFINLASSGYYDGLEFHRVISGLLIQSGDKSGSGTGGESSTGEAVLNEFSNQLHNFTGALCMAGGEGGNFSQFYIVAANSLSEEMVKKMEEGGVDSGLIAAYRLAYGAPHLDFRYTVIGQVYEGLDIVMRISEVKTDSAHRPNSVVTINSVKIETYSEPAK